MNLDEFLQSRERIEVSRQRVAAAYDAMRASHRRMGEVLVKLDYHRLRFERIQMLLKRSPSET